MLLEHHFRVGRHLKRINDGTCSSLIICRYEYLVTAIDLSPTNYISNYRDPGAEEEDEGETIRARFNAIAWQGGWRGKRKRRRYRDSLFNEIPSRGPSPAKNLVPSPRNDNRMDGCALDLHRVSRSRKFPPSNFTNAVSSLPSNLSPLGSRFSNTSVRRIGWEGRRPRMEAF